MLTRFEKLTGHKPHPMIRRGLYRAHRDFDKILKWYEKEEPFYLYARQCMLYIFFYSMKMYILCPRTSEKSGKFSVLLI